MSTQKPQLVIAADHAGYDLKENLRQMLEENGHEVEDLGPTSSDSVDYPDYAHPLAQQINQQKADYGILICGSGNGVAMTANRYPNVYAALCWTDKVAHLARTHNNANVICLPSRFIETDAARQMVKTFLSSSFDGGRHERRVSKINRNAQKTA